MRTISMLLIGITMAIVLAGCSPKADTLEIEKDSLIVAVGETSSIHYEISPRKDNYKFSWSTSDESIATIEDGYYGYFGRVTGKSTGECTITLEMGGKTDTVNVKVVIDPDVDVYPVKGNKFTIYSDLPIGTKLKVNLKGNEFENTSIITLVDSEVRSKFELIFENEDLTGEYTLTIELPMYEEQTNEVKEILGENYKYVEFNNELFVRTYTLPYKSDLEIICETPYSQLTEGQRIEISKWLKDKYDLYREIHNGYWMKVDGESRPILSVVQEMGAERYNKTYEQMVAIWHYYILDIKN